MTDVRNAVCIALVASSTIIVPASAQLRQGLDPTIRSGETTAISDHVFVILDNSVSLVPNVGIIVGERAALVIDTGLGEANGRIVLAETLKVAPGRKLYVAATHAHPEHDLGAVAFPAEATLIRSRDQQADIEEFGMALADRFATFSPRTAELLEGAAIRPADVVFGEELVLDLGGVTVRVRAVGPTHTRGDMTFYVEQDRVLFSGDVIMPAFPAFNSPYSSVARWLQALDELEALGSRIIVPSHGAVGSPDMLDDYQSYLIQLQSRAGELAERGIAAEEAAETLASELTERFSEWPAPGNRIQSATRAVFRDRSRRP